MELADNNLLGRGLESALEIQQQVNEVHEILRLHVEQAALIPERDRERFAADEARRQMTRN